MQGCEYVIRNVRIADGTGKPVFYGEVGISGEDISCVSQCASAGTKNQGTTCIDGKGMLLMPGIVDIHCHSEGIIFHPEKNPKRVMNGITTEIAGNCGTSDAPITDDSVELLRNYTKSTYNGIDLPWSWRSFEKYLDVVKSIHPLSNYGSFIGHGTLRMAVMGFDSSVPSAEQMEKMKTILRQSLRQGAVGLSCGLIYPPGVYAGREELMELARVVKEENKLMAVHMRNESTEVVASVKEMISIAEETGVRMQISHHKVAGHKNRGLSDITLKLIGDCKAAGYDIGLDAYPYTSGCTQLSALLPPWVHEGGTEKLLERIRDPKQAEMMVAQVQTEDASFENLAAATTWDKITISSSRTGRYNGLTIEELSSRFQLDPVWCVLRLLQEEQAEIMMIIDCMNEYDLEQILRYEPTIIITDGVPSTEKITHPRYLGSFFRVLAYYCRERKLFSFEKAVAKMTSMPAERCGINDRGVIAAGKKADLLLVDIDHLRDEATYNEPQKVNSAVKYVWLNGQMVVEMGEYRDVCAGQLI